MRAVQCRGGRGGAEGSGTSQNQGSSPSSPTADDPRKSKSPAPERRLSGRGVVFPGDKYPADACVCSRPRAIVFCQGCGYFRPGRKRIQCPQHVKVHFLYDVEACERCHLSCYLDECVGTLPVACSNTAAPCSLYQHGTM